MKKHAQGFNTAPQDSNPGSLSRESGALPLSHCALRSILNLFMDDREVTGWTNAAGSIEASNNMLLFHNIQHFNMN